MTMSTLELRDKVQRYLLDMGLHGVEITRSGGFTFRKGSTRVFVDLDERGKDDDRFTVVRVTAPFLQNVPATPEVFEWVAKSADDWLFGHLGMLENEDGTYIIVFSHRILGDYLDPQELYHAVAAIAVTADDMDDELAARFGGETFHSDSD
jgi:hypothetical protein